MGVHMRRRKIDPLLLVLALLGLLALAFALSCGGSRPLRAATLTTTPVELARFSLLNPTTLPRRDVVTLTLPFRDDADYRGERLVTGDGTPIDVQVLGATWPDGSWRQATAHVPIVLAPNERRSVPVYRDTGFGISPRAFRWGAGLLAGIGALAIEVRVGTERATLAQWTPIASNASTTAWRARTRIPNSPVWAQAVLEAVSECDHVRLWIHVGDSDPRDPALTHQLGAVQILVRGPSVSVHHAPGSVHSATVGGGVTVLTLAPPDRWGDGESLAIQGRLLFAAGSRDLRTLAAESIAPVLACADWRASDAWGPWGYALPRAEIDVAYAGAAAASAMAAVPRTWEPWAPVAYGLNLVPGDTGDQSDFAATTCSAEAAGWPDRLYALQWSVYREACRPTHLREVDGSPARLGSDLLWDSRPDSRISRTLRGKTRTYTAADGHGWYGRDRQHWSACYLTAYALLTSDRWALDESDHLAETWLGLVKDGASGAVFLDSIDEAARGEGRPLQAGSLLWLATGRADVRDRLRARVDLIARQWTGATTSPVRPMRKLPGGDGRYTSLQVSQVWLPWQEGLGLLGLDAAAQVLDGYAPARTLVRAIGETVAQWGVWQWETGEWTAGKAVEFRPGGAAGGQREDYAPFLPWMGGGLVAARREALAAGDAATVWRCDSALAQLAAAAAGDVRVAEWLSVR